MFAYPNESRGEHSGHPAAPIVERGLVVWN